MDLVTVVTKIIQSGGEECPWQWTVQHADARFCQKSPASRYSLNEPFVRGFANFHFIPLSSRPRSLLVEHDWDRRSIAIFQWFLWFDDYLPLSEIFLERIRDNSFECTTHYLLPRRLNAVWQKDASTPSGIFECSARELGLPSLSIGRSISCLLLPPLAPFAHHSAGILARARVNAHRPARPRN